MSDLSEALKRAEEKWAEVPEERRTDRLYMTIVQIELQRRIDMIDAARAP